MKKSVLTLSAIGVFAVASLASCGGGGSSEESYKSNAEALGMTTEEMQKEVLGSYDEKYQAAAAITDSSKIDERYKAMAQAEYSLIYEDGIIVPWYSQNGVYDTVSKTVAHQAGRASYGLTSDKFKNVVKTTSAITQTVRAAIDAEFESHKSDSNAAPVADSEGWLSLAGHYENPALSGSSYTYGSQSFTVDKNLKTTYTKEPDKAKLNYLSNTWTYNSYHYTNMVDGLVENDKYGNIVGALADKYQVVENEDGTETWKFHVRSGAKWVKNGDGSYVADVVADDWVAALEYVLDAKNASGTASIVYNFVKGAYEYYNGDTTDFADVGIKAEASDVISFTLNTPTPYFMSCLTYSPYLPVNRDFLASEGSDFGSDENHLLVNGAFRITEHVASDHMTYTKNASYWDLDQVYLDSVLRKFVPGTATASTTREWYESGTIDSFTVQASDASGFKKYVTGDDGSGSQKNPANAECVATTSFGDATYIGYMNFARTNWEYNDASLSKSGSEIKATAYALMNKNFRLGFLYGMDVESYMKRLSPTEPYNYIMRGYTNRELCSYNGKDYADYVDDVYNEKQGTSDVSLTGIINGSDPIHSADKAKAYFADAKKELIAAGLSEKSFPIKVDVILAMSVEVQAYEEVMYDAIEAASDGVVDIQYNIPSTDDQDTDWGSISNNYDFSLWSGCGPDYADPNTYLHTMCINGDMVNQFGF